MKKILSLLLLVVLLSACVAPAVESEVVQFVQLTPTGAFTQIPTLTAIPPTVAPTEGFPTFTPPTALPGQPNEIRFAVNGTYTDVVDSIATGANKVYSLNAMQGQVMSVSILPQIPDGGWGYIPMQIKGADGSVLCPQSENSECMFWRGALPASQDYFVTLSPDGDAPQFVMRVAINPPGREFQYFEYSNSATGVSLIYPDTFAPALPTLGNYKSEPELTLQLIDSELYEKTNLSEVYLFVSSTAEAQTVATCTEPNQSGGGPEYPVGDEIINGFTFAHSTSEGAGAGNYYQQEIYRTVKMGVCHEVIYFIHYTNAGNYTPGAVTEFNREAVMQNLQAVFSTLAIK
jgi:hypothetical protein